MSRITGPTSMEWFKTMLKCPGFEIKEEGVSRGDIGDAIWPEWRRRAEDEWKRVHSTVPQEKDTPPIANTPIVPLTRDR